MFTGSWNAAAAEAAKSSSRQRLPPDVGSKCHPANTITEGFLTDAQDYRALVVACLGRPAGDTRMTGLKWTLLSRQGHSVARS